MRGRDICTYIVNKSIEYRNIYNDDSFYTTFYSVNKLMYYAHCEYLKQMGSPLIRDEEPIFSDTTGPFFDATLFLFGNYNYSVITDEQDQELPLFLYQKEIVNEVIKKYGRLTDQEIGILVKQEKPYIDAISSKSKIITTEMILDSFKEKSKSGVFSHTVKQKKI